jgi:hypothetical protein
LYIKEIEAIAVIELQGRKHSKSAGAKPPRWAQKKNTERPQTG